MGIPRIPIIGGGAEHLKLPPDGLERTDLLVKCAAWLDAMTAVVERTTNQKMSSERLPSFHTFHPRRLKSN